VSELQLPPVLASRPYRLKNIANVKRGRRRADVAQGSLAPAHVEKSVIPIRFQAVHRWQSTLWIIKILMHSKTSLILKNIVVMR
jgi:hypothetical protein